MNNITIISVYAISFSLSAYCFYIASHNDHNVWIYIMGFLITQITVKTKKESKPKESEVDGG